MIGTNEFAMKSCFEGMVLMRVVCDSLLNILEDSTSVAYQQASQRVIPAVA